jgi:hypothetical protein
MAGYFLFDSWRHVQLNSWFAPMPGLFFSSAPLISWFAHVCSNAGVFFSVLCKQTTRSVNQLICTDALKSRGYLLGFLQYISWRSAKIDQLICIFPRKNTAGYTWFCPRKMAEAVSADVSSKWSADLLHVCTNAAGYILWLTVSADAFIIKMTISWFDSARSSAAGDFHQ